MKKLLVLGFIAGICSSLSAINIFDYGKEAINRFKIRASYRC